LSDFTHNFDQFNKIVYQLELLTNEIHFSGNLLTLILTKNPTSFHRESKTIHHIIA